jgi:hypothetical protein
MGASARPRLVHRLLRHAYRTAARRLASDFGWQNNADFGSDRIGKNARGFFDLHRSPGAKSDPR